MATGYLIIVFVALSSPLLCVSQTDVLTLNLVEEKLCPKEMCQGSATYDCNDPNSVIEWLKTLIQGGSTNGGPLEGVVGSVKTLVGSATRALGGATGGAAGPLISGLFGTAPASGATNGGLPVDTGSVDKVAESVVPGAPVDVAKSATGNLPVPGAPSDATSGALITGITKNIPLVGELLEKVFHALSNKCSCKCDENQEPSLILS